jgi:threonylcarbamoyladenosine tRNA methylthiotransferase MtaB
MRYRITTLGCRVNHAEARELESILLDRGLARAAKGEPADLEVVHSCTVTNTAAAKSRHAIRAALRRTQPSRLRNPDLHEAFPVGVTRSPQIIVTGCFGSTNPKEAARLSGGRQHVVPPEAEDGSALTERFSRRVDQWLASRQAQSLLRTPRPGSFGKTLPLVEPRRSAGAHIRAELKIQDGCDAHCTFCVIPRIRSTLRSKTVSDTVAEARRLVDLGHREIVLTGIFIGAYGRDTALRRRQADTASNGLAELLDAVARVRGLERLRVSSMEPGDVSEALLDAMVANRPVVVPHLHLPLQSGSDAVLKRMNRQYRIGEYLEMVHQVNETLTSPDGMPPAITTDIICGFPGETTRDFNRTIDVASRVGYLHMHVFPYSPRRGTAAGRWRALHLPPALVRQRVRTLIELERDPEVGLSIRYRRRLFGRTVRVIIEQPDRSDPALMTGRCDHYALIHLRTNRPRGALVYATVCEVTADKTLGRTTGTTLALPIAG